MTTPAATLAALYAYRCALYDAQQRGTAIAPPTFDAAALVDAYGHQMHQPGASYMTFAQWHAWLQTPQPPRRFAVAGER